MQYISSLSMIQHSTGIRTVFTVADRCHATSRFRFPFPISVFYSLALALALAPIGYGTYRSWYLSATVPIGHGTYRPRYLSVMVPIGHGTCHFVFPISIFQFPCYRFPFFNFRFPTSRHLQARWQADRA